MPCTLRASPIFYRQREEKDFWRCIARLLRYLNVTLASCTKVQRRFEFIQMPCTLRASPIFYRQREEKDFGDASRRLLHYLNVTLASCTKVQLHTWPVMGIVPAGLHFCIKCEFDSRNYGIFAIWFWIVRILRKTPVRGLLEHALACGARA